VVNFIPRGGAGRGVYQIAKLVPPSIDDEPRYRIKSEAESHLRSAKLSALNRR
jgi:hypothetical protein